MRERSVLSISVPAELKKILFSYNIDISKYIREKLISDLARESLISEVKDFCLLEEQIQKTTKIMQVLNSTKIIFQQLNTPKNAKTLAKEVIKTLELQKKVSNDDLISKIIEEQIETIKLKVGLK